MATAYVKYRSGGGYQQVADYDYVLDYRKLMEIGYYRDSGFVPSIVVKDGQVFTDAGQFNGDVSLGPGQTSQYRIGVSAEINPSYVAAGVSTVTPGVTSANPDEISHTAPRQLSWFETTLTFLADSSTTATFTADSNGATPALLRLTVADALLFSGKTVSLSGADLPNTTFASQLYYATAISATQLLLQEVVGGAFVAWGDAGDGSRIITVVEKKAEFPWANIFGWSDTAPTR
jgi:hypothetical protein